MGEETKGKFNGLENNTNVSISPEKLKEGYCREFGGLFHFVPLHGEKAGRVGGDDREEAGGSRVEGGEAHRRAGAGNH